MNTAKDFLLALVLLLLLGTSLSAQDRFSFGPRVGVNFASVSGDNIDVQTNTRPVFGLTSTYSITESFGVTVDLLYSGEGYEPTEDNPINLNYLRVPVLFNLFLRNLGEGFRPNFYLGAQPGFMLSAKQDNTDRELEDGFNTFDIAGVAGLGFNVRLTELTWLNTDLRYQHGFTDILDDNNNDNINAYNRGLQLSIGVAFGL